MILLPAPGQASGLQFRSGEGARTMRSAPKMKQIKHTLWLVQPVLQFIALIVLASLLARCSPLSPSTEKHGAKGAAAEAPLISDDKLNAVLADEQIEASLKEVPASRFVNHVAAQDFQRPSEAQRSEEFSSTSQVYVASAAPAKFNVRLSKAEREALLPLGGRVKLNLARHLSQADAALVRKRMDDRELSAEVYLLYPNRSDSANYSSAGLRLKVAVAFTEQAAALDLRRDSWDSRRDQATQERLLAALQNASDLVVVLQ